MRNLCDTIFYIMANVLPEFHICMNVPLMYSTGLLCFLSKRTYFTNGSPVFNISPGQLMSSPVVY